LPRQKGGAFVAEVSPVPSTIVREVDEKIAKRWAAFLDAFAGVAPAAMEAPGVAGSWSLKQVLGHVAYWDAWEAIDLRKKVAGNAVEQVDWQAENDLHVPSVASRALEDVIDGLHRDHDAIVSQLRALDPNDPRTPELAANVLSSTTSHYDEHAAEIRARRCRTGH
jgi:uncharacterized damage-inducible protein DinB